MPGGALREPGGDLPTVQGRRGLRSPRAVLLHDLQWHRPCHMLPVPGNAVDHLPDMQGKGNGAVVRMSVTGGDGRAGQGIQGLSTSLCPLMVSVPTRPLFGPPTGQDRWDVGDQVRPVRSWVFDVRRDRLRLTGLIVRPAGLAEEVEAVVGTSGGDREARGPTRSLSHLRLSSIYNVDMLQYGLNIIAYGYRLP